jgi:AmpD protein
MRLPVFDDVNNHWLNGARQQPSPNANERPQPLDIELLVIHNISLPPGEFGSSHIEDFFLNRLNTADHPFFEEIKGVEVSAHLLIRRTGEVIQFVPFNRRAWHAGRSSYKNRNECNDYSIGIELEGTDTHPYEHVQYSVLAKISATLIKHYPLMNERDICGHSEIAPGRKTDPGESFNWKMFRDLINNK